MSAKSRTPRAARPEGFENIFVHLTKNFVAHFPIHFNLLLNN
jgi:hypothetical protein